MSNIVLGYRSPYMRKFIELAVGEGDHYFPDYLGFVWMGAIAF